MARFAPRKFTEILARLVSRVVARTDLTDTVVGGFVHTILAAVARELDDLGFQLVNLQRLWDLDTASGEDLDERAKDVNPDEMTRAGATKAAGSVTFGRANTVGAAAVAAGTLVRVPAGAEFALTIAATFADGDAVSTAATIEAVEAGAAGNVDAAAISQMAAVSGVDTVTNAAATSGGQDEETDAAFRARIKLYLRSLPRGTPQALTYAALSTAVDGFGRVVTVQVVELSGPDLGTVEVYCDDGNGTIELTDSTAGTPESVLDPATGGERRLFLANVPVRQGSTVAVTLNAALVIENTDYTLNYATGQITFDDTVYPAGLTAGDVVEAEYTWYTGLLAEAQKIIDGDPSDYANYPGYRAAGTYVLALPPVTYQQVVTAAVVTENGYDRSTVLALVEAAIMRYINGLGIGTDVIFTELVHAAQAVAGVYDLTFTTPTANVNMGDGELARVIAANVNLA